MIKTTTRTNIWAVIISWAVAILISGALVMLLRHYSIIGSNSMTDAPVNRASARQPINRKQIKEQQVQRKFPGDYAAQLVKKEEEKTKNDLIRKLQHMRQTAAVIRKRKDQYLTQVEKRKLPNWAPRDANNTSMARNIPEAGHPPLSSNPTIEELYDQLIQFEDETQKNNVAVNAAKQALANGLSFPEVYNSLKASSSKMESFADLLNRLYKDDLENRSKNNNSEIGFQISNTADLNRYREFLREASLQAGTAGARLQSMLGIPQMNARGAGGNKNGDGGSGDGSGDGGVGGPGGVSVGNGNIHRGSIAKYEGAKLNPAIVKSQALPGRRFSRSSDRKGWLYINTWYMIGPWENFGRDDYSMVHPPEISIDLDAEYSDGQKGVGIEEIDSDPLKMIGPKVRLDGVLRWKFMQSESMHNTVPVTTDHSTYYAYTELYFDEPSTMLVALGTDDAGKVWINGKEVWEDQGTSWYYIDEHIVPFSFRQGWNRVLVRLENSGGGPAGFSFLICPTGAVR